MKRSVMQKWVKALESGRYKQATGQLMARGKDGKPAYCCLGVLCQISGLSKWKDTDGEQYYLGNSEGLPDEVQQWAGMKSDCGTFPATNRPTFESLVDDDQTLKEKEVEALTIANDEQGLDFKQIAKIIRKHYKDL